MSVVDPIGVEEDHSKIVTAAVRGVVGPCVAQTPRLRDFVSLITVVSLPRLPIEGTLPCLGAPILMSTTIEDTDSRHLRPPVA